MVEPDLYKYLATSQLADVTTEQLNNASKSTYINASNLEFWRGPITVARLMQSTRTYCEGYPIPELSSIKTMAISDAGSDTLKPTSPGLYQIVGVFSSAAVSVQLVDGTSVVDIAAVSAGVPFYFPAPLIITPTMYLQISNASGGAAAVGVPYHTVGV